MKNKLKTLMLTVALLAGFSLSYAFAAEVSFTDTSGHWAEQAITSVVEKGLFNGTSETTFSPDISMDRGMFVTVLGRFAEKMGADIQGSASFNDVPDNAYYASYVAWGTENGIVKGTSETTFSPTDPVTREQMCALFIRLLDYAKYDVPSGAELTFTDSGNISDYAKSNVQSSVQLGLIKGVETADGMAFYPAANATRAEVATVFLRLDGLDGIYEIMNPTKPEPVPVDPSQSPDPVDPTPVNPTPSPGPVDPTPVNPSPSNPPDEATDEEITLEEEVIGYMRTMLSRYDGMTYLESTDQAVKDCMKIITDCMSDALDAKDKGTFLSEEYVKTTYSEEIENAKLLYKSMNEDQQNQMNNVAVRMESMSHLRIVLDYFGFSGII